MAGDLTEEVGAIRDWGAAAVLSLVRQQELGEKELILLKDAVTTSGMEWRHLPIRDLTAPDAKWSEAFERMTPELDRWLSAKGRIFVHCRAGAGRAGTVAALLMTQSGISAANAIAQVRHVRPGAIETAAQERWLRNR